MELIISSSDLKDYILALKIVQQRQPLLSLDENLKLHREINMACVLFEKAWDDQAKPYRGQRKVKFDIPEVVQTNNLNKALIYGFEQVKLFKCPKKPITNFDKAYFIAMANKIVPH